IIGVLMFSSGFPGLKFGGVKEATLPGFIVTDFKVDSNGDMLVNLGNILNQPIRLAGTIAVNGVEKSIVAVDDSSLSLEQGQSGVYLIKNALPASKVGESYKISQLGLNYLATDSGLSHTAYGSASGTREDASGTTYSISLAWETKNEFDQGNYNSSTWNDGSLTLSSTNGSYISDIRDAGENLTWESFTLTKNEPYPNPGAIDNTTVAAWNFESLTDPVQCEVTEQQGKENKKGKKGPSCEDGPVNAEGMYGDGVYLDGSNDFINVSNNPEDFNLDNITIEVWVYLIGSDKHQRIFEKGNDNQYKLRIVNGNLVKWLVYGTTELESNSEIQERNWTHIIATFVKDPAKKAHQLKIYMNGVLDTESTSKGTLYPKNNMSVVIGKNPQNSSYFQGYMDELRVYSRPLETSEVAAHYVRGGANIKIQARSCNDPACNGEIFTGPDNTPNTFYRLSQTLNLPKNRYIQFKAFMSTENIEYSPKLYKLKIKARH
ncbi:MAG: LamG domain-containing protein, partial [Candidatus Micrarchaeota archaeon]